MIHRCLPAAFFLFLFLLRLHSKPRYIILNRYHTHNLFLPHSILLNSHIPLSNPVEAPGGQCVFSQQNDPSLRRTSKFLQKTYRVHSTSHNSKVSTTLTSSSQYAYNHYTHYPPDPRMQSGRYKPLPTRCNTLQLPVTLPVSLSYTSTSPWRFPSPAIRKILPKGLCLMALRGCLNNHSPCSHSCCNTSWYRHDSRDH